MTVSSGLTNYGEKQDNKMNDIPSLKSGIIIRYEFIGIIVLMIANMLTVVWWASSIQSDVRYIRNDFLKLSDQLNKISTWSYSQQEAKKDFSVLNDRINEFKESLIELKSEIPPKWLVERVEKLEKSVYRNP